MSSRSILLLLSGAAVSALLVQSAQAQTDTTATGQTPPAGQSAQAINSTPGGNDELLGEVVVTATKQADSVNRVPLSLTAVTQKSMDQQGVRNIQDLSRVVPGLTLRRSDNNNINPAIRGIIASGGAPTTGVYLDDVALQKRNAIGATVGNGSPFPPLFDLERVEVLRGPQGTLYGGSSEGGTIRFITPSPSLNRYSAYGRAQASSTRGGEASYEAGIAVGGPIVQDRIGFRASYFVQHNGGYLDHYDQYTGQRTLKDTNDEEVRALRLAATFAVTDNMRLTPALYSSYSKLADASPSWLNEPTATTTPARYFTATGAATTAGAANVAYSYPSRTYGPYNFYGPGRAGGNLTSPAVSRLLVPNLNFEYDFPHMQVRSITSYIHDQQKGLQNLTPSNEIPGLQAGVPFVQELPNFPANFYYYNKRHGITEELRFSSDAEARPLSWVFGLYYANLDTHAYNYTTENLDVLSQTLRGVSTTAVYRAPLLPGQIAQIRDQNIAETELAAFGQLNYALSDRLRLNLGLRGSRNELGYNQTISGPVSGYSVPTVENGGIARGNQTESPVTPKVGAEFQLDERNLLYVNAAKGFRPGGVNLPLPTTCGPQLAAAGLASTPSNYEADTVWAYEGGAKLRLFDNRAQINSSLFYIDWKNIQYSVGLPGCVFTYTSNAGKAVSKGFDVQANVRVISGLSANIAFSYTKAAYSEDIRGPAAPGAVGALLVNAGDRLPTPPWNVNLGAQYDFALSDRVDAYVRADYQYTSSYKNGLGPGTTSFAPDIYNSPDTSFVSARAGVIVGKWDLSLFAKNLTNSKDLVSYTGPTAGRYGCSNASCSSYSNYSPLFRGVYFRPREIGLTASVRY